MKNNIIEGKIKFYEPIKDYGFIVGDDKKEYYFKREFFKFSSDTFSTDDRVSFSVLKSNSPKRKDTACGIELVKEEPVELPEPSKLPEINDVSSNPFDDKLPKFISNKQKFTKPLPPPCPHCGARKGSHFGYYGNFHSKIYLCNVCQKEHTYGDIIDYNADIIKFGEKQNKFVNTIFLNFLFAFLFIFLIFLFAFLFNFLFVR